MKEEVLDRVIKPFFDKKFVNSTYVKSKKLDSLNKWEGFVDDLTGQLFLGVPENPYEHYTHWYTWGEYFSDALIIFGLDWEELWEALRRYVNKEFGLKIEKIF